MGAESRGKCHLACEKESGPSDLHRIRQTSVTEAIFVRQTRIELDRLLGRRQAVTRGSSVSVLDPTWGVFVFGHFVFGGVVDLFSLVGIERILGKVGLPFDV